SSSGSRTSASPPPGASCRRAARAKILALAVPQRRQRGRIERVPSLAQRRDPDLTVGGPLWRLPIVARGRDERSEVLDRSHHVPRERASETPAVAQLRRLRKQRDGPLPDRQPEGSPAREASPPAHP